MIALRPAVADDAEGVKRVHVQAWREAYVGWSPQEVLDRRDEVVSVERWRATIDGGAAQIAVAVDDTGRIVGWAARGAGRDDDAPYPNELNGLYALDEVQGGGIGRALLEFAIGADGGAYLWVLRDNLKARGFYAHLGFAPDGAEKGFAIGGMTEPVPEIRLVRHPAG